MSLAGVRVAVTRARTQAEDLAGPLRERGAQVLIAPLIRIAAATDAPEVRAAVGNLDRYEWLVLTSANGVELFVEALRQEGLTVTALAGVRVACVGPATAGAAASLGIQTNLLPEDFVGDALAERLAREMGGAGARVLLARAGGAREELPALLRQRGGTVDEIELYRSLPDEEGATLLRNAVESGVVDMITFTSGSTVRYFAEFVGQLGGARVAVIGPATAQVARQHGLRVDLEASTHTTAGLIDAIVAYYRRTPRSTEE